jgi:signal transduction histidine kinase
MKPSLKIKRPGTVYILYWFLLTYIIAALIWWFIALNRQNNVMSNYRIDELNPKQQDYQQQADKIKEEKSRKTAQYVGEGITFFLLIVAGATFVFRAIRKQLRQSQQQQNFMMTITHELKTPVAVTKLNLETLLKRKLTEEQQQRLISITLQEAERLNSLCNNLLLTGQIEGGGYQLINEKIKLDELVNDCIHGFRVRFPDRDILSSVSENIYFSGDQLMLQMAINNLLDNAIKYSDKKQKIEIVLKKRDGLVSLLIKDEGGGISDQEKQNVFKKFYRVGNLNAKGTGLGLYLTKRIVEQYNGRIRIINNTPQGSIFEITLKEDQNNE